MRYVRLQGQLLLRRDHMGGGGWRRVQRSAGVRRGFVDAENMRDVRPLRPKQPMASHVCMDMGTLIIDPDRPNCAGLYYEERTESVEQVINEMIYCIVRLSERGECGEVMDEGLAAREYNAGLTPCYQAFADRLEALEMTLDGR